MDIQIKNLVKKYGVQRAVDDISFTVKSGEVVGFLGPNGAGKTTTMKIITCYMAPSDGDVLVGNYSVRHDQSKIKKMIGYLPEHNPLYLDMPVMDYLAFAAAIQGVAKSAIPDRIKKMIRLCGLDKEKHKKIGELSKGYRQRVGLAQAMIHDPAVLVLDEPTTGLDPNQIVEIRELIKQLGKEKTVILSTHILPEVEATCDRVIIINEGKIVANDTSKNLRQQESDIDLIRVRIEDGEANTIFTKLKEIETINLVDWSSNSNVFQVKSTAGMLSRRAIFHLCKNNDWVLTEMTPVEKDLEEVFRNVTNN